MAEKVLGVLIMKNLAESLNSFCCVLDEKFGFMLGFICCSTMGEIDGDWPPSEHKENPGLDDGIEFSTLSVQERVVDDAKKEDNLVSIGGGKTIFPLVVIIIWQHGFLLVPSGPLPDPEFPHFSNVPSGTAGGFFKATTGKPP
ncbi:hypothetical protein TNCT_144451 [Trichonephila clavata]|uniref:Uncharacterized protein n=1 Tax=Trichonephila clavata TaxID=2740835 RepID=A0A8X6I0B5_TRICU|nr:hypothetical protein TNCT_144451 [Trichonephila clavata]